MATTKFEIGHRNEKSQFEILSDTLIPDGILHMYAKSWYKLHLPPYATTLLVYNKRNKQHFKLMRATQKVWAGEQPAYAGDLVICGWMYRAADLPADYSAKQVEAEQKNFY